MGQVISGSMEPIYMTGDFIITDTKVEKRQLQVGDDIVFRVPYAELPIIHRVYSVATTKDGKKIFRTKGVNNDFIDPGYIEETDIIGKVIKSTSYPPLFPLLIVTCASGLFYYLLYQRYYEFPDYYLNEKRLFL